MNGRQKRPTGGGSRRDAGNAIVEFVLFTVVAVIPLAWAALALQQFSALHADVERAAAESLRAFLTASSEGDARHRADLAADLILSERPGVQDLEVRVACDSARCLDPGAAIRVAVSVRAELPRIPILGLTPSMDAQGVQYGVVDAYAVAR